MDYIPLIKTYFKNSLNIASKIFLVLVILLGITAVFLSFANEGSDLNSNKITDTEKIKKEAFYKIINEQKPDDSPAKTFTLGMMRATGCSMLGILCTNNPNDENKNFDSSVVGFISGTGFQALSHPPASGVYYVFDKIQDAGFIPSTYAAPLQGVGFAALRPFQNIWVLFRNFTYFFFVIIIAVLGFMIMFRTKINAQTAISVENSLPKIVIALILVTFSFAIAGFMIDLMYISMGLIVMVFSKSVGQDNYTLLQEFFFNPQIFGGAWEGTKTTWALARGLTNVLPESVRYILGGISSSILWELGSGGILFLLTKPDNNFFGLYRYFNNLVGTVFKSGTPLLSLIAGVLYFIVFALISSILNQFGLSFIIFLLLIFTICYIIIRITFLIFYSYINILMLTILSPIILCFEAIPGKSVFTSWLKSLIFHLSTFPALTLIILLSRSIMKLQTAGTTGLWQPPYISALDPSAFQTLIGAAIIFMSPDLIKTFKSALGIKPMASDMNIFGLFAGGMAVGATTTGILSKASTFSMGISGLGKFGEKLGIVKPSATR
jgi:hypothetical protein